MHPNSMTGVLTLLGTNNISRYDIMTHHISFETLIYVLWGWREMEKARLISLLLKSFFKMLDETEVHESV